MNKATEERLKTRIQVQQIEGKTHLIFENASDLVLILRKISIHKFTRNLDEDDRDYLDDVMDCDSLLFALAQANEVLAVKREKNRISQLIPFDNSGYLETGSHFYKIVFESLRRKVEKQPSKESYPAGTDHRLFVKTYFAPFLITDEQADEIVEQLNMSKFHLYGRLR